MELQAGREGPGGAREGAGLCLHLLGTFRVSVGSRTLEEGAWRLRKAAALVKLLALAPGHRLHREQVLDQLWPELDPAAGANNLHQVLHSARRLLNPAGSPPRYLRLQHDQLVLAPDDPVWVDVEAFEAAAALVREEGRTEDCQAALALYAGELLPGDRYEDWAAGRREELRRVEVELCLALARRAEEGGQLGQAVGALHRAIKTEPALEEAHRGLMRLYAMAGQRQQALRQYQQLCEILAEELDAEPDPDTRALYEQLLAGELVAPPLRAAVGAVAPTKQHNLPSLLTSFIGREREQAMVRGLLAQTRLLTLTGVGGSGKTRLALEVAEQVVEEYPDGVWLVELAALADGGLVPQAVAAVLGVAAEPERPLLVSLTEALEARALLLVLDNCEHLVAACAQVAQTLLHACPQLRVLATSRVPLAIDGEVRWQVPPLPVPAGAEAAELEASDAVRLFVERARYRQPGISLTPANAAAIGQICTRLEGMPLAIELATARVGVLSLEGIAQRLDDALSLLASGSRTALPRHQTLRGALDWSYQLLPPPEQQLFARLAVFAGGWDLSGAEAVGGEGAATLDLLSQLVDHSLVSAEVDVRGVARYRMLEPVRQYAQDQLTNRGEREAVQRRHARVFLELAQAASAELTGPDQARWLDRLDAEHDNLRAALRWWVDSGELEPALRLSSALARFWQFRGYLQEGRGWLHTTLAAGAELDPALRAEALWGAGCLAWAQADFAGARRLLEESRELFQAVGDQGGLARTLNTLANVAEDQGDSERAVTMYEQSLALCREMGDRRGTAMAIGNLGAVAAEQAEFERARALHEESLALFRELGDQRGIAIELNGLASVAEEQGDYETAQALLEEGLAVRRRLGDQLGIAGATSNLGSLACTRRDYRRAQELYLEAMKLLWELGERRWLAFCLEGLGEVAAMGASPERAARLWGAMEMLRETIGASMTPERRTHFEEAVASVRAQLGEDAFARGWQKGRSMSLEEVVAYARAGTAERSLAARR